MVRGASVSPAAPLSRSRACGAWARACLAVAVTAPALALTSIAQGPSAHAAVVAGESDITVVTANLRSPQNDAPFQQDAAEVLAQDPDLITYNEVAFRDDSFLAPDGYELWRPTDRALRYQRHTPVAWRTDVWHAVDWVPA